MRITHPQERARGGHSVMAATISPSANNEHSQIVARRRDTFAARAPRTHAHPVSSRSLRNSVSAHDGPQRRLRAIRSQSKDAKTYHVTTHPARIDAMCRTRTCANLAVFAQVRVRSGSTFFRTPSSNFQRSSTEIRLWRARAKKRLKTS